MTEPTDTQSSSPLADFAYDNSLFEIENLDTPVDKCIWEIAQRAEMG